MHMIEELLKKLSQNDIIALEAAAAAEKMKRNSYIAKIHKQAITQLKDGRWCTHIYPSRKKRKTIICKTREELLEKLVMFYEGSDEHGTITIHELCVEWLDKKLKYKELSLSSHTKYVGTCNRFFTRDHEFCRTPVSKITEGGLRDYIKDMIVDCGLTRKTYNQLQIVLKGTLLYAKEQKYTDFSAGAFFADLQLSERMFIKKERLAPELETFSDAEVAKLIQYLWEEKDLRGLGLILMFQTGMRVGELAALRWENVLDGKIIISATEETWKDPETGKKKCEVVDHAKTDAGNRTIYLPEQAEKTINAIRTHNSIGEYVFMDKLGRIRAKRFNTWLHRTCRNLMIPERSTHKIRKTYASVLLSNGVDEKLVSSQMGHTDIITTRGIYYYNRDSEEKKKVELTRIINF